MEFKKTYPTPVEHTKGTNTCDYIILHHTGTKEGTIKGVLNGLNKRADYASCHYCINTNGDIYKIGKDTDILRHAWNSQRWSVFGLNRHSIGIEIIWPLSDWNFSEKQRESLKELVLYLLEKHEIPMENILRHKDVSLTGKWDPSDTLWNEHFKTYADFIIWLTEKSPMSKYSEILKEENERVKAKLLFSKHEGNKTLTEQEVKELIDIAFLRATERFQIYLENFLKNI